MTKETFQTGKILLVDDDEACLSLIDLVLQEEGFDTIAVNNGKDALKRLEQGDIDLVISDVQMPYIDGDTLLREIKKKDSKVEVILITAHATLTGAAKAINNGAQDYLTKPFNATELITIVKTALDRRSNLTLANNNKLAKGDQLPFSEIDGDRLVGSSPVMLELFKQIGKVAKTDSTVLILGESGVGKEMIAKQIHKLSNRFNQPFVALNCGALTESLLETELFGHLKGAFTGAQFDKPGLFLEANKGTIFLDEITETSLAFQSKLLRVLQEGEVLSVGASKAKKIDVRVIAASNQNIDSLVKEKLFRLDLLYRLRVVELLVAPLRERKADIPLLIEYFLNKQKNKNQLQVEISEEAINCLSNYDWPGNVRQLGHVVEKLVVLAKHHKITTDDLPKDIKEKSNTYLFINNPEDQALPSTESLLSLAEVEYRHVINILNQLGGNKSQAARVLGIDRKTLDRILKRSTTNNLLN
ncbi:MAG: sigma-54-dependent Fis family transcriptional regulator [Acidobacteria bacterium]|nr:sigma-54-dependent Fis family transcriptional regulator [Acidobacteriota bacterium]